MKSKKPDIVISGLSGQYPLSDDLDKFKENLFAGVDMVTADEARWPVGYLRLPTRNGKVYGMNLFDFKFFGMTEEETQFIDPQDRLLMEEVYKAILDAGIDPRSLRGTNTGYFHGACYTETHRSFESAETIPDGKYKSLVTRVPRFLGLRGPILDVDTACGSGLSAFSEAYHSIKAGICDQAIATASNTVFRPRISSQFRDLKMITKDGKCKCLDASADGYVRSEAVVACFLQKAQDAKRIYCYLLACRSNSDGYKEEGITFPSIKGQTQLLLDTYADAGVDPADIDYIEAHITGTKAGDPVETNAMYDVICSKRQEPVKIGCLKSNIGHTEGSSGLCAISKAAIIYQTRLIPPNIHYNTPNTSLRGIDDGKMEPVTKVTPFDGHFIPVNCFGFGGANTHLLTSDVNPNGMTVPVKATCDPDIFWQQVPYRLVNVCGRTKEAVDHVYNGVKNKATYRTREFLSLLDDFSKSDPSDFPFRGYAVITADGDLKANVITESPVNVETPAGSSVSLTLDFTGPDVATAAAFDDLKDKFNTFKSVSAIMDSISARMSPTNASVLIAKNVAYQVAFVDFLKELKVKVTKVVGQSTGQLAAAYIAGVISKEVALSAAFMVLDDEGVGQFLTESITANNGHIISNGHPKWVNSWVGLESDKVAIGLSRFNQGASFESTNFEQNDLSLKVNSRLAIRSRHLRDSKSDLKDSAFSVINCLGSLYTHGLFMDIKSLSPPVTYPLSPSTPFFSPIVQFDHSSPISIEHFLNDPTVALTYQTTKNIVFRFEQNKSEDTFIFDHKIDGRTLFPATGYLMLAWHALAKLNKNLASDFPVRFDDVKFVRAVVVSSEAETILSVRINEDSGHFEIKEADNIIVSGRITALDPTKITSVAQVVDVGQPIKTTSDGLTVKSKDVYKELKIRGYDYGPYFQAIKEAAADGSFGHLIWREVVTKQVKESLSLETGEDQANLWIRSFCTFTDAILQLSLLRSTSESRVLFVPTSIESMTVIPEEIKSGLSAAESFVDPMTGLDSSILKVTQDHEANLLVTSGIVVKGFKGSLLSRRRQQVKLLDYRFHQLDLNECLDYPTDSALVDKYIKAISCGNAGDFDLDNDRFSVLRKVVEGQKAEDAEQIPTDRDIIFGGINNGFILNHQKFFKSCLDAIVYNLISNDSTSKLEVLEVNEMTSSTADILTEKVKEYLSDHLLYNMYSVSTHLVTSSDLKVTDDVKQEFSEVVQLTQSDLTSDAVQAKIPSSSLAVINLTSPLMGQLVKVASEGVKEGGFMVIIYRQKSDFNDDFEKFFRQPSVDDSAISDMIRSLGQNWTPIMTRTLSDRLPFKLICLRKHNPSSSELENVVIQVGSSDFDSWLDKVKAIMCPTTEESKPKKIWLTANPAERHVYQEQITGLMGMAKSLRLELGGQNVRLIIDYENLTSIDLKDYPDVVNRDLAFNVRLPGQSWGSYEHFMLPDEVKDLYDSFESSEHVYLRSLKPGDLSSLTWVKNSVPADKRSLDNHVKVHFSALNFKDILFATGRLSMDAVPSGVSPMVSQDSLLGLEYSGVDSNNNRVMGILPFKALASSIPITEREADFMWPVPDEWSLEDAATVPVVYATVMYALIVRGRMARGESILIHAGAGGVGLAAINVALHFGCRVFTTVGSDDKRSFLLDYFKGRIPTDRIFNSRQVTFEDQILEMTEGRGVDIILNSLSDEKFDSTIRVLSSSGRFLEIGKVDMITDKKLPLGLHLGYNQSFHGVFLDTLTRYTNDDYFSGHVKFEKEQLKKFLSDGIREGYVRPLPRKSFGRDQVVEAFRFMATGKHIGKVVIQMRSPEESEKLAVKCIKSTFMSPDKSYIVVGGLGGLGLEVVQWLVVKGARNVLINSRRGITNNYQKMVIGRLRREGHNIQISQADSTTKDGCQQLLEAGTKMATCGVGGIFNGAVVYKDVLFSDQTVDTFEQVASPKSNATIFLDELSRQLCPNLDYFVTFSSISSGRGNEGQTNYNFGNSVMDSICLSRVSRGLPGLSVQLGVVGDVGIVADLHSGHADGDDGPATRGPSSEVVLLGSASQRVHSIMETLDRIMNYRNMGCIASVVRPSQSSKSSKEGAADLMKLISNIIGLKDISRMDPTTTLGSLGIDSLIAVEIKQVIDRTTGVCLGLKEVRELTIKGVLELASTGQSTLSTKVPEVTAS